MSERNPDDKPIRQCVCFAVTFKEILKAGPSTIEEIQAAYGCSTSCGLCLPYLQRMLETGETEFAILP